LCAMEAIQAYEVSLSDRLLGSLCALKGATVYGVQALNPMGNRVPTVCFNIQGVAPSEVAIALADKGIGVRDGNMYSPRLLRRLGIPPESGAVRASLVHYNTLQEIDYFVQELTKIAAN